MFEGLVVSENGDAFPILSRRLSGDNHDEKTNRSIGSELAVEALSRCRDNPRTLLSCQPGLVAFVTSHSLTSRTLEKRRTQGAQGHGAPCTALQGTSLSRLLLCDRPFLFWLGEQG